MSFRRWTFRAPVLQGAASAMRARRFGVSGSALGLALILSFDGSTRALAETNARDAALSLKSYLSFEREKAQLFDGGAARQRALRRLARVSSTQAHEAARLLDVWLETQPLLAPGERLELARTLAPLASQSAAKRRLREFLTSAAEPTEQVSVELKMAQHVAALGLARSGDAASLELLGQWLKREPEIASVAASAIRAYPPRDLSQLLAAAGPTTPLLLQTLGELGDPRAYDFLSRTLKRATPELQAQAALALGRLGVRETIEVSHYWLDAKGIDLDLLAAATELLLRFEDDRRHEAFTLLLSRSPERALEVARRNPSEAVAALGDHFDDFNDSESTTVLLEVLSQAGEEGVGHLIEAFRTRPELRSRAAFLLGNASEVTAYEALRAATDKPALRAQALRALILSYVYHSNDAPDLEPALERLVRTGNATERAIARFGLAVRSEAYARRMLNGDGVASLEAAASVFWWHGDAYRRACATRLAQLSATPLSKQALALSPVLSDPFASEHVPVSLLVAWIHSGLPVALPASWRLATLARPRYEALLSRLLQSPDYELRAATYLGLGLNPKPEYTGVLARALSTELNPGVRLSIAAALQARAAVPASEAVLEYARLYDPSTPVREWLSSERGAAGHPEVLWIDLELTRPSTYYIALSTPVRPPIALQVSASSAVTVLGVDDEEASLRIVQKPFTER